MSSLARLAEALQLLDELLAEDLLAPDPERSDWPGLEGRLQLVRNTVRKPVLEELKEALDEAGDARSTVGRRVAYVLTRAAALAFASGDAFECDRLLARAADLAPELQNELSAARRDPRAFARIQHGRWLHAHGRHAEADRRLRAVERESLEADLKAAARGARKGPRALTSAPPLFRLNGCGVSLYGKRDAAADGSYVATYCIALLFVPVFLVLIYVLSKRMLASTD